jgi:hypothetical protein
MPLCAHRRELASMIRGELNAPRGDGWDRLLSGCYIILTEKEELPQVQAMNEIRLALASRARYGADGTAWWVLRRKYQDAFGYEG